MTPQWVVWMSLDRQVRRPFVIQFASVKVYVEPTCISKRVKTNKHLLASEIFQRLLCHLLSFLVLWLQAPFAKNPSVATATNHCYSFHDSVDFAQQILVRMTQIEATSDQLRKIHPAFVNIFVRLINFYKKLFTEYMQFSKNDQYQEHWKIRPAFLRFRADTAQATIPEHNFAKNATWSSDIRSQT